MKLNILKPDFLVCLVFSVLGPSSEATAKDAEYYLMPGLDHGLMQSPINILSWESEDSDAHQVTLHFQDRIKAVENLGHTVQLDFEDGSTIERDGKTYYFKQMHFHTPSEHLIDGMTFPMEMHIVNSTPTLEARETPGYLVISVLFKMGRKNSFISELINAIPRNAHETRELRKNEIKLHDLFSDDLGNELKHFYHYTGSLTTPPFSESVHWYVLKQIVEASPEQIRTINEIEGNNARHIQARYGRVID